MIPMPGRLLHSFCSACAALLPMLVAFLFIATTAAAQESTPRLGYRIINSYPHDMEAFTQGLQYHDGYLFEGTGKNGFSSLRKVELETGEVLQSTQLSRRYFGEGIQIVGERVFQLTWQSNIVFVYSLADFEQVDTFFNPTEGWGLTWNGEDLILSDGSATLRFLDPETFTDRRSIEVSINGNPVPYLNELEYIDGEIWANVWQTDFIVRIDPDNGRVTAIVDLTGLSAETQLGSNEAVLNGIAWDAERERLFVTGKHWANLFEIELVQR